uniref:Uncharacterized protein n=1 Tax=Anguilla anguilla TaxID=7936 RepID=A0A0E9Q5Q4_ANGAN
MTLLLHHLVPLVSLSLAPGSLDLASVRGRSFVAKLIVPILPYC